MKVRLLRLLATALLSLVSISVRAADPLEATGTLHGDKDGGTISRHLYGHFAEHLGRCIYDGIWVGEDSTIPNTRGIRNDIVDALRERRTSRTSAGPAAALPTIITGATASARATSARSAINMHWGQVIDTNAFGTHEFLDLCEQLDCEPYIAGNVGSGTPQEMRDWIEYMTFDGDSKLANLRRKNGREKPWKIKYFGVGNENWGCGGNMRPEYYADLYRRYATFCRDFSGNRLTRVACGPGGLDQNWTRVLMDRAAGEMQALLAALLHCVARLGEQDAGHRFRRKRVVRHAYAGAWKSSGRFARPRRSWTATIRAEADRDLSSTNGARGIASSRATRATASINRTRFATRCWPG